MKSLIIKQEKWLTPKIKNKIKNKKITARISFFSDEINDQNWIKSQGGKKNPEIIIKNKK